MKIDETQRWITNRSWQSLCLEQAPTGMLCRLVTKLDSLETSHKPQLALGLGGSATLPSRYRRLQRFFQTVHFDYDALARLIVQLFDLSAAEYYLTLDRTNWKWGQKNINILTLGIVYQGAAIPVYWLILNKQGNSNQRERVALLHRFIHQFGRSQLLGVLAEQSGLKL